MNLLTRGSHYANQLLYVFLIASLMANMLSACSTQPSQSPSEPTPSLSPTLPPFDAKTMQFEVGQHNRDENCSMIFDFQMTSYGPLTIIIADNLVGTQDYQELTTKVINLYINLYNNSPVPMSHPSIVTILSNPDVGQCYSKGNLVFVSPDELDSASFTEELLGAATGIGEYWMLVGLSALTRGEQPDNIALKTWYQNTDDLDMAGLFIARFNENWATEEEIQIARISATSLVQYALEVEKIQPELLEEQINNDVRTRWLESLGVERTVEYPYDERFRQLTYSQSSDCSLIAQADTMRFCLNRLPEDEYFDEISEAEFLIDYAYYGRKALEDYILAEAPSVSQLMDPQEMISIEVRDLQNRLGSTDGNKIVLNMNAVYYYPLHEIAHTFNWNSFLWLKSAWLSEGFAEYLGKLVPIYPQTQNHCIFEELRGRKRAVGEGYIPEISFCYCLDSEQLEAAQKWYLAQGGQMENEESIDPRLYTDAVAFATVYRDATYNGLPIGKIYDIVKIRKEFESQDGQELSYTQAASFVAWLCDTYSIDRVLDVYVNHAEDGLLDGKSYEELKNAWQNYLIEKGQGIEIPGTP